MAAKLNGVKKYMETVDEGLEMSVVSRMVLYRKMEKYLCTNLTQPFLKKLTD